MTLRTHEAPLLPIVGASMNVLLNTISQVEPAADRLSIDEAIKVNPLATI